MFTHASPKWRAPRRVWLWAVPLVLVALALAAHGPLVQWQVKRLQERLSRQGYALSFAQLHITGITRVELDSLKLHQKGHSEVFFARKLHVSLSLWHALTGSLKPTQVALLEARIRAPEPPAKPAAGPKPSLPARLRRLMDRARQLWPAELEIQGLDARGWGQHLVVEDLKYAGGQLETRMLWNSQRLRAWGNLSPDLQQGNLQLSAPRLGLKQRPGGAGTERAWVAWHLEALEDDLVALKLDLQCPKPIWLHHPRLNTDTLRLKSLALKTHLRLTHEGWEADSASSLNLNGLEARWGLQWQRRGTDTLLRGYLNVPYAPAQRFLDALPQPMFALLQGMQAKGQLGFRAWVHFDSRQPEKAQLNGSLTPRNLRVLDWGGLERLMAFDSAFTFTTRRDGQRLLMGPANPDFLPLAQANPFLFNALFTSEDPAFYQHQGILPQALAESLVANLRSGRFRRGGSTISMQLVKNLVLTPEKTLGRKLHELMVVWWLEHFRLLSKGRMLELYLNLIEWGPGVYGATAAARFYFAKPVAALSLDECLFLAMIVPRPRAFMYHVLPDGRLKDHAEGYFRLLAQRMKERGLISELDAQQAHPRNLRIVGKALALVPRTEAVDSLRPEPDEPEEWTN